MNDYIKIALQADPSGMISGFRQAEGVVGKFVSATQSAMKVLNTGGQIWDRFVVSVQNAGKKILGTGLATATGLGTAVKAASDYQVQIKNIQGLTKNTDFGMGTQSAQIMDLSGKLPQSSTELAAGLYDIASSGFAGADGLKVLEASATAASAGLTKTEVASKAIVAVMNAYGLSANKAADISDILFQGVNVGVVTFEQLAGSMGQWVGMAAQVGVAADEGTAAIAAMTLSGIQADEAATYLSRVMEAFIQPSEGMNKAVKKLGYSSAKSLLDAKGLGGALMDLQKATGGNASEFNNLFGSIQAARGAMAITASEGKNWARVSGAIMNPSARKGAAKEVYSFQERTLSTQMKLFKNSIQNMFIAVGTPLLKPLSIILEWGTKFGNMVTSIVGSLGGWVSGFGAVGSVLMIVAGGFATLFPKIVAARIALTAFRAVMAAVKGSQAAGGLMAFLASSATRFPKAASGIKMVGASIKSLMGLDLVRKAGSGIMGLLTGQLSITQLAGGAKGIAMKTGQGLWSFLTSGMGKAMVGIGAMIYTITALVNSLNQAKDAGKEAGKQFKDSLSMDSLGGLRTAGQKIADERNRINQEFEKISVRPGEGIGAVSSLGFAVGSVLPFGLGDGMAERGRTMLSLTEQEKALDETEKEQKQKMERFRSYAALAAAQMVKNREQMYGAPIAPRGPANQYSIGNQIDEYNKMKGEIFSPKEVFDGVRKGLGDELNSISGLLGKSGEEMMFKLQQGMEGANVSFDNLMNPDVASDKFKQVVDYMQRLDGLSVNDAQAVKAFDNIGDAAGDAKSQIESLGDALKATLDQSFGYEAAQDSLEGLVNAALQAVNEIKDNGNLAEAMDFGNMSEDALKLRDQWRGLTEGMVEETTSWAKSQENITGADIANHVQEQIRLMQSYGEQMGLSTEFVNHYTDALQAAVDSGAIVSSVTINVDDAQGRLKAYLESIGKVPEERDTFINLINSDVSREQVMQYGAALGMTPVQIMTAVSLQVEDASTKIQSYLASLGDIDKKKVMTTVVKLVGEADPTAQAALRGDLKKEGLNDEQINLLIQMSGDGLAQSLTLQQVLKEVEVMNPEPTVNVQDNASTILNGIITKLGTIKQGANANVTVTTTNKTAGDPAPNKNTDGWLAGMGSGKSAPKSSQGKGNRNSGGRIGYISYADGGVDLSNVQIEQPGTAQIYMPKTPGRFFAEPETGGEAYIPMSPTKRARSLKIWQEVGKSFGVMNKGGVQSYAKGGVTAYRSGGVGDLSGRLNSNDKKNADKAAKDGERAADKQKKAAEDQKKAAEDQKQAAKDARSHERDVWSYKVDVEQSSDAFTQMWQLAGQQAQLEAYSDEWMDVGRQIHSARQEVLDYGYTVQDALREVGAIDETQYLSLLQGRVNDLKPFSKEWWELGEQIHKQKEKIKKDQQDLEDTIADRGWSSHRTRIGQLMQRMATEGDKNEYQRIYNDILEEQKKMYELENKYGAISNADYVAFLRQRMSETEKFSDEWADAYEKIADIERSGLEKIANIQDKFGGSKYLSKNSLIKWLERQVKMGQQWADTVAQLKQSGAYSQEIIDMVVKAGPQGAGLAKALLSAVGSGEAAQINSLIAAAKGLGVNTQSYDTGGYLPPGYTLAYNGLGRPERVGGGDIMVDMRGSYIDSPATADRFANKLAFATNSGNL